MQKNNPDPLLILRGLAALAVVIWHISPPRDYLIIHGIDFSFITFPSGLAAVWVFFCLSGYLMGKIFFMGKYQLSLSGIIRFFRKRALKIFPLYFLSIPLSAIFFYSFPLQEIKEPLIRLYTFTANDFLKLKTFNSPLWSISTEIQFYFFVPVIFFFFSYFLRKKFPVILMAFTIVLLGFLIRAFYYFNFAQYDINNYVSYIYTPLIANLDIFLFGFLMNLIILRKENKTRLYLSRKISAFLLILLYFLTAFFGIKFFYGDYFILERKIVSVFLLPAITYITVSYFILSNEMLPLPTEKTLKTFLSKLLKVFEYAGKLSFGIYIWHSPVINKFQLLIQKEDSLPVIISKIILGIGLPTILAILSYRLLEKPLQGKKQG